MADLDPLGGDGRTEPRVGAGRRGGTRRAAVLAGAGLLVGSVGLIGCGDDDDGGSTTSTTSLSDEVQSDATDISTDASTDVSSDVSTAESDAETDVSEITDSGSGG